MITVAAFEAFIEKIYIEIDIVTDYRKIGDEFDQIIGDLFEGGGIFKHSCVNPGYSGNLVRHQLPVGIKRRFHQGLELPGYFSMINPYCRHLDNSVVDRTETGGFSIKYDITV